MKILSKNVSIFTSIVLFFASGCSDQSKTTSIPSAVTPPKYFYIVTAPIDKEQAELTRLFFVNAQANRSAQTQIITATNRYTVAELCQGDSPAFPVADQEVRNGSDIKSVVDEPVKRIEPIVKGNTSCNVTPKVLTRIVTNLKQASARGEKLVIIMQIPWKAGQISNDVLSPFKKELDEIARLNNVEKVVLFGVDPSGSDRIAGAFESFNNKGEIRFMGATSNLEQILAKMKQIRSDVLKK
jgi:hypothetical protein